MLMSIYFIVAVVWNNHNHKSKQSEEISLLTEDYLGDDYSDSDEERKGVLSSLIDREETEIIQKDMEMCAYPNYNEEKFTWHKDIPHKCSWSS